MPATYQFSIPGEPTTTDIVVVSQVFGVPSLKLAYSETLNSNNEPVNPTYLDGSSPTPTGLITHSVHGLRPFVKYYARLATSTGNFIGDVISWRTFPATGMSFAMKIALVSCQSNPGQSLTQIGWQDIINWDPDMVFMIGDFMYKGAGLSPSDPWTEHLDNYNSTLTNLTVMRKAIAHAGHSDLADDHEISGDNGDSNISTSTGQVRAVSIYAMQQIFATYPTGDTRPPDSKHGLYRSFMMGDHVRFIMLDNESTERSLGDDTDTFDSGTWTGKSFLGPEQDAWLKEELQKPAVLNIVVTGKAILGDQANDQANHDKPPNYSAWRTTLYNWITANTTTDGKPIQVMHWGGDRHANGYKKAATPGVWPGPVVLSSGIEQHALDQKPGEDYDFSYGFNDHTLDVPVVQYMRMTVSDDINFDGSGVVRVDTQSREVHNTFDFDTDTATAPVTWVVQDGGSASDAWGYPAPDGGDGGGDDNSVTLYLQGSVDTPTIDGSLSLQRMPVVSTYRWYNPTGAGAEQINHRDPIDPNKYHGALPLDKIGLLNFRNGRAGLYVPSTIDIFPVGGHFDFSSGRIVIQVPFTPQDGSFTEFGIWPLGVHDPAEFYVEFTTENMDTGGPGQNWVRHNATFAVGRGFNMYPRGTYVGVGAKVNDMAANDKHFIKMVQLEKAAIDGTVYPSPYSQAREVQTIVHPDRLNFSINPAFQNNRNSWGANNHGATLDRVPDGDGWAGQITIPDGEEVNIHHTVESLVLGRRYTASFYVYAPGRAEVNFDVDGGDIVYSRTYSKANFASERLKDRETPYRRIWVVFDALATEVTITLTPTAVMES